MKKKVFYFTSKTPDQVFDEPTDVKIRYNCGTHYIRGLHNQASSFSYKNLTNLIAYTTGYRANSDRLLDESVSLVLDKAGVNWILNFLNPEYRDKINAEKDKIKKAREEGLLAQDTIQFSEIADLQFSSLDTLITLLKKIDVFPRSKTFIIDSITYYLYCNKKSIGSGLKYNNSYQIAWILRNYYNNDIIATFKEGEIVKEDRLYAGTYSEEAISLPNNNVVTKDWAVDEETACKEITQCCRENYLDDIECVQADKVYLRTIFEHPSGWANGKPLGLISESSYWHAYRLTLTKKGDLWNKKTHVWAWKNPEDKWYLILSSMCQRKSWWSKYEAGTYDQIKPGYEHELIHWLSAFLGDLEGIYPDRFAPIFQGAKQKLKKPEFKMVTKTIEIPTIAVAPPVLENINF